MKNSPKKRPRSTAKSVLPPISIPPMAPVSLMLDGMISTLQGLLGLFDRSINVEVNQLIELTTALRDEACGAPPRSKKRK